ncbi:UNVERIFIED_CONTAM: hypothetical protein PYX00_004438 [Menopon gallinae]|uniref:Ribosome biogenesis protein NOP53 n=1 Tax=Menopon gallinae TaxID=328185 RepID=A0AAW2I591_9NEOP
MATAKRKRVSKKTKKSWRKNVDINDVEDFLEEQRWEERTGFKVSELKDEDLFEIHKTGDNETTTVPLKPTENITSKKPSGSMRLRETSTPVAFSILEKRSAVPDPVIKRNRVKTREEKRHPAVKKIFQERLEKGILTAKQKMSLRDRKKAELERRRRSKIPQFKSDLWGKENELDLDKDWLYEDTVRHTLTNTGNLNVKPPKSIRTKPSQIPAVEPPHPGTSYNPSLKDHRSILELVAETEQKMEKSEKHLKRVTTDMFQKVKQSEADKEWLKEMSAGLADEKQESDEEITGDYTTVNPPVKNKKKTLQKRRRLREANQLQAQIRQKKIEKKKISDMYKLRKFNAMFKKQELKQKSEKMKREKLKELKPFQTKKLSRNKYEEPLLDFSMVEDISGNLRGMKSDSNLLKDRYMSLQKRNILEPTVKHFKKKIKKKKYERAHTKMGWEPKGY